MPESGETANLFQADLVEAFSLNFRLGLVSISGNDGTPFRIVIWEFLRCLVSKNGHAFVSRFGRHSFPNEPLATSTGGFATTIGASFGGVKAYFSIAVAF